MPRIRAIFVADHHPLARLVPAGGPPVSALALDGADGPLDSDERARARPGDRGRSRDATRIVPSGFVPDTYEENAFALSEGKRLYSAFNCVGCHAHGGGGMGPALIDDKWIYGHEPGQIFATIVEGRPNGMPSFGAQGSGVSNLVARGVRPEPGWPGRQERGDRAATIT